MSLILYVHGLATNTWHTGGYNLYLRMCGLNTSDDYTSDEIKPHEIGARTHLLIYRVVPCPHRSSFEHVPAGASRRLRSLL